MFNLEEVNTTYFTIIDYNNGHLKQIPYYIASYQTGSRYTCDPPVMDTDEDIIVLVTSVVLATEALLNQGFSLTNLNGCSYTNYKDFVALFKGDLNILLTQDFDYYQRFVTATKLCKKLNLTCKLDRIALFDAVVRMEPLREVHSQAKAPRQSLMKRFLKFLIG